MPWPIHAEEWKKTQLVEWAQDEFMTKPGVYTVDYEAVKSKGREIGLNEEDIDDVVDTLQKVLASRQASSTRGGAHVEATMTAEDEKELAQIVRDLGAEGDRKASEGADTIEPEMLRKLVSDQIAVAASTGYTDVEATARAALLLGQETKAFWKKAVASVKKDHMAEMKAGVSQLTKWGTVKPSLAAVRDIVIKVLQSHDIYPYPELVQPIMENAFQERLLGPETHWPLAEGR